MYHVKNHQFPLLLGVMCWNISWAGSVARQPAETPANYCQLPLAAAMFNLHIWEQHRFYQPALHQKADSHTCIFSKTNTECSINLCAYEDSPSKADERLAYFAVSPSSSCSVGVRCSRSLWFSPARPALIRGTPSRNFYPRSTARPCAAFPWTPLTPWPWHH